MNNNKLQIENGNFTRIINPLIDNILKIPFKGCELAVALFIIRKTYGFNKTEDEISLSQFCKGLNKTKPTIMIALKNLQLVKVAILVKKGNNRHKSNIWKINKYIDTWELVKTAKLVKHKHRTGIAERLKLVKTAIHTKDNIQKTYTKDIADKSADEIPKIIKLFEEVNPLIGKMYGNKTQRSAVQRMLKVFGREKLEDMIKALPAVNSKKYYPKSTTPYQLENNIPIYKAKNDENKIKGQINKSAIIT